MKITISVPGRFHAFDMAMQLQKRGLLEQVITSYPAYKVASFGINANCVRSIVSKEIAYRIFRKLWKNTADHILINDWYDIVASKKINFKSDIYVIWSGFGLNTIRAIRRKNPEAIVIIERGSTHIAFQREVLEKAYRYFPDLHPMLPSYPVISKEISEYNEADFIAVPTEYVKKTFTDKHIPENKILVEPYGVSLSSFTCKSFTIKERLEIIFAGNFSVQKGARTFIDILQKTAASGDFHFTIVGSIEHGLMDHLKSFIELGVMEFIPHVPQNELGTYYHRADVFLFPSLQEGMAMVVLQAMACGLTVIATPESGAAMLIRDGDNGFLVQPDDTQKIIQLLYQCKLDPAKMASVGKLAREYVQEGHTWDDYGKKIIQRYQTMLR